MAYCWEVYQKSECETCKYFQSFQAGTFDPKTAKDIVVVEED